jgi:hypothetical protein
MVFVIATLAIPDQLGIVALYIIMSKLPWLEGETWNGKPGGGDRARSGQRLRFVLHATVHHRRRPRRVGGVGPG